MNSILGYLCCREEEDQTALGRGSWHFFGLVLVDVGVAGLYNSLIWHDDRILQNNSLFLCEECFSFIPTKWCTFVQSSFYPCPPMG